jgi:predicted ATPase
MAYPESTIYHLGAGGISEVKYDQTEHVQVTRDFLKRPSYFLKILLDESRDA